jgi:hypothetical protein
VEFYEDLPAGYRERQKDGGVTKRDAKIRKTMYRFAIRVGLVGKNKENGNTSGSFTICVFGNDVEVSWLKRAHILCQVTKDQR